MTDYDDAGLIGIRADFSPTSYFTFGLSRLSMLGGDGNGWIVPTGAIGSMAVMTMLTRTIGTTSPAATSA